MNELVHTLSVEDAANELLRLLDEAFPHITSAIVMSTIHGSPYDGPRLDGAMNALRHALTVRETAIPFAGADQGTGEVG